MKVVILHPPLYPVNHKLFNELGKYCDLHVICFGDNPRLHINWKSRDFISAENNYKLIVLKGPSVSKRLQFSSSYLKYIYNTKPDVVISTAFWIPSLLSSILKRILKYKFCVLTDANLYTASNLSLIKNLLRKFIVYKSDILLSGSKLTSEYLYQLTNDHFKIKSSYQVIDVKDWRDRLLQIDDKSDLRVNHNIHENDRVLLCVSNLEQKKNIESIISQMKYLNDYKLIIIGEGDLYNDLKDLVDKLNLNNLITFLGRKNGTNLLKYFKMADIFIFPSKNDQFGFVVSEALASGLPVICSEFAGASSLIEDGFNGYIIDPNNFYHGKINLIYKNLEQFSQNAIVSISNYTIENKAKEMYNLLLDE